MIVVDGISLGWEVKTQHGSTSLYNPNGKTMMSDATNEIDESMPFINAANGRCLVVGLGLGIVLQKVLFKVACIDVVELNQGVVNLVWPFVQQFDKDNKVNLIMADAYVYEPTKLYDAIWLDIWLSKAEAHEEGLSLQARYMDYLADGGWIGYWR